MRPYRQTLAVRSLLAQLGTQAKCEIHLGGAGMRVGSVENVENWPFFTVASASSQISNFRWCAYDYGIAFVGCAEGLQAL